MRAPDMISSGILRSSSFKYLAQKSSRFELTAASQSYRGLQWSTRRVFAEISRHRKDAQRIPTPQSTTSTPLPPPEPQQGVKPESVQKPKPAVPGKQDVLLAEKTVSTAEQRKADWAILKEMTKYLWPKNNLGTKVRVGISLGLLSSEDILTRGRCERHNNTQHCHGPHR